MKPADFHRAVLETIQREGMIDAGDGVLVGVSGGSDSVALLLSLLSLKRRGRLRCGLHVAHLNHMLRGAEADADERFVRRLCARLRIGLTAERRDVRTFASEKKLTIEEAAREVRYDFLLEVAKREGCNRIAVGHNADDNVETITQRIIRGTGVRGLAGIPPVREMSSRPRIVVIRPLIRMWRCDIESYLRARGERWRTDSSNLRDDYLRNRIRNRLIPLLEAEYNAEVKRAVLRLGEIAREVTGYIEQEAAKAERAALLKADRNEVVIDTGAIRSIPAAVQQALLRRVLERLGVPLKGMGLEGFRRLMSLCAGEGTRKIQMPRGFFAERKGGQVAIYKRSAAPPTSLRVPLPVPGRAAIPELGIEVAGEVVEGGLEVFRSLVEKKTPLEEIIDFDAVEQPLEVRLWRRGDRFKPLGMKGMKKLQDFFTDLKVPADERRRVPIVATRAHPIWVVGYRIDDRVKVTARTRRLLRLSVTSL